MIEDRLTQFLKEYPNCLDNNKVFKAYINDIFPEDKKYCNVFSQIHEMGVFEDLRTVSGIDNIFITRIGKRLISEYGIGELLAYECVNVVCKAYGVNILNKTILAAKNKPEYENPRINNQERIKGDSEDLFTYEKRDNHTYITGINDRNLESITIPAYIDGNKIDIIGEKAFSVMGRLNTLIIEDGIMTIGKSAFEGCSCLRNIEIPNSVRTISNSAFRGCPLNGTVKMSNNVMFIGGYAFYNTSMSQIYFGECIQSISDFAFADCFKNLNIILPDKISMGLGVFKNTSVTIFSNPESKVRRYAKDNQLRFCDR